MSQAEPAPELTLDAVRDQARIKLKGICAVYPVCDGGPDRICQRENYGKAIGLGGAGLGGSFRSNVEALANIKLQARVVGDSFEPDTSFEFLGRRLTMPIMGASTGGLGSAANIDLEADFCRATIEGCEEAGTISWRGDTYFYSEDENHLALKSAADANGWGIPIFKPRSQKVLLQLAEMAARIGCPAFGVDLDGYGSTNFARVGKMVYRKSAADLQELVRATKLPFIAKGIMHPDDAAMAVEAGAKVIVVSNHGGRVLDGSPGTAEVLPSIVARVGSQTLVLADGGIRNGYDVLKMLALGAKAVLVGRDLIRAGIGAGSAGVRIQMEHYRKILRQAMLMTGCPNLAAINESIMYQPT